MKKFLRSMMFALLTVVTLTASKPSHAIVGLVAAPGLVTAGAVMGVAGMVVTQAGAEGGFDGIGAILFGGVLTVVGIVVLDGEQGLAYGEVSPEQAHELGLTNKELLSFNAEIDQVNAIASHIDSELGAMKNPTVEDSAALWQSLKAAIAPETFSALQKVTVQLYK